MYVQKAEEELLYEAAKAAARLPKQKFISQAAIKPAWNGVLISAGSQLGRKVQLGICLRSWALWGVTVVPNPALQCQQGVSW